MIEVSLPHTKAGNLVLKFFLNYLANKRGRAWSLKKIIRFFPKLNKASLAFGNVELPLDLRNDTDIGYFYSQGIAHERFYQILLISLITNETVFYDIGANLGYYSLLLAPYVNQVYSFEPNPKLSSQLRNLISANLITNIKVFNFGLSKQNSYLPFYFNPYQHDVGSFIYPVEIHNKIDIEVKTLNNVLTTHGIMTPDIIKIDTEGSELDILEGYSMILEHKPIIFIEWIPRTMDEKAMIEKLRSIISNEYDILWIGSEPELIPIEDDNNGSVNLLLIPYSNDKYEMVKTFIK